MQIPTQTIAVGNTPLVKISDALCPPGRTIYAKCEYFNPLSSVKDRLALAIIEAAEKDGSLKPGQTLVEATSGNTGIGTLQHSDFVFVYWYLYSHCDIDSYCNDVCTKRISLCDYNG